MPFPQSYISKMSPSRTSPPPYQHEDPPTYSSTPKSFVLSFVARESASQNPFLKIDKDGALTYRVDSKRHAYTGASTVLTLSQTVSSNGEKATHLEDGSRPVIGTCKILSLSKECMEISLAELGQGHMKVEKLLLGSKMKRILVRNRDPGTEAYRFQYKDRIWTWQPRERSYRGGPDRHATRSGDEQWDKSAMELHCSDLSVAEGSDAPVSAPPMDTEHDAATPGAKATFIHHPPIIAIPPYPRASEWQTGVPVARLEVLDNEMEDDVKLIALLVMLGMEKMAGDRWGLGDENW